MAALLVCPVFADNVLHPGTPVLDRPTLTVLGVQLPISGDDNFNATVAVRYRPSGTTAWIQGLPLFRVHPENTVLYTVMPQFAGSIFNLQPGTSYDIALDITDVNGHVSQTLTLSGTTRPVPSDPAPLRVVNVTNVASLEAALSSAQAGDLIQIADGTYQGSFFGLQASGTPQNPIVIRGASEENTVLDGGGCTPCNVLEVYGSYVHVERLSLRNAERGLRFQGNGATANVVRYVHISNTSLGIGSQPNETDFYIADNILEGVLVWPHVYADDNGQYANNDGINMQGNGHVVAHNTISGYGDAMKTSQNGDRADDFYGNDILWTYDNGIELDASEGNTRCFRNRFTNAWDTLSVQPILGGPAYLFRNIVVNSADEQMKFHAVNTTPPQEPNGVLAYHNTFVSAKGDLYLCTSNASHHFWIENNIFVGPPTPANKAVMWCGGVDDGHFDYDGYWPDGPMSFNLAVPGGYAFSNWPNFAAVQAGGLETHGLILNGQIFANGLVGMPTYTNLLPPQDVTLAYGSPALDRGLVLPNINDGYTGAAPDLGALESGCPQPTYGPRPAGVDETNEPIGCASSSQPPGAAGLDFHLDLSNVGDARSRPIANIHCLRQRRGGYERQLVRSSGRRRNFFKRRLHRSQRHYRFPNNRRHGYQQCRSHQIGNGHHHIAGIRPRSAAVRERLGGHLARLYVPWGGPKPAVQRGRYRIEQHRGEVVDRAPQRPDFLQWPVHRALQRGFQSDRHGDRDESRQWRGVRKHGSAAESRRRRRHHAFPACRKFAGGREPDLHSHSHANFQHRRQLVLCARGRATQ